MAAESLKDKVMIVTGGSRGIGRQIVLDAAARGARVAFCSRELGTDSDEVCSAARALGLVSSVLAVRADVGNEDDVQRLFDEVEEQFGRVDIVVNNAGISNGSLLLSLDADAWDRVVAINLTGAFLVSRRAVRDFARTGRGTLIAMGSIMQNGAPCNASYATSKGGLAGLTRAIASDYGSQAIHANLVVTGYVETRMTEGLAESMRRNILESIPAGRPADPREIASVVLFLATNSSPQLNGRAIYVSGGLREVAS